MQTRRTIPLRQHPPHRIGLFRHSAQAVDHAPDPPIIQRQPVDHRIRQALALDIGEVDIVRILNRLALRPNFMARPDQRRIFAFGLGKGQFCRRSAGLLAHRRHQVRNLTVHHLSSALNHHVVAMDQSRPALIAQNGDDLA